MIYCRRPELPGFDLTLADHPVLGRRDPGIGEIELGRIECGALRADGRLALCELRIEDRELALRGTRLCPVLRELRLDLRMSGCQLFASFGGRRTGAKKPPLPRKVAVSLLGSGGSGRHYRARRLDVRKLQLVLRPQRLSLRQGGRDAGCRLRHGGTIVIIDQLRENLPFVHSLVILYRKLAHVAGNPRRNGRDVRLEVGIVRPLPPCPAFPPCPICRHHDDDPDGHQKYENPPPEFKNPIPVDLGVTHGSILVLGSISPG